jgi:galactokinase
MSDIIPELSNRTNFRALYGDNEAQGERWRLLDSQFHSRFPESTEFRFFSSPGRTELGGNHTDHNNGIVLAAAVDIDSIAVASRASSSRVTFISDGYPEPFVVDLDDLIARDAETGTTAALIRGIAARFSELGYKIGGFNAYVTSEVLVGSGLSSSASIEVLIATIFNALFNESKVDPVTIAQIGQFAENNFFGKPSGLMDQIACAVGGAVMIDFREPSEPVVTRIEIDSGLEYDLVVVDTGGSHEDLTQDYATIPSEMRAVANLIGKSSARGLNYEELLAHMQQLRKEVGDRAILRTLHFLSENERVTRQVAALRRGDYPGFFRLVSESGDSSSKWLQNGYSPASVREQGIMLALAITEQFLKQAGAGACRVHGGGFAGTIQVWLPRSAVAGYRKLLEPVFGENSVIELRIRPLGAVEI